MLQRNWCDLSHYLFINHRQVVRIRGDGFCFLHAISKCLEIDHYFPIDTDTIINHVTEHILENYKKYLPFFAGIPNFDQRVSPQDLMCSQALEFFTSRNFNQDVVDILVKVTCDALGLDLVIYQQSEGNIMMVEINGDGVERKQIKLKFSHDNKTGGGNHYDSIVNSRKYSRSKEELSRRPLPETIDDPIIEDEIPEWERDPPMDEDDIYIPQRQVSSSSSSIAPSMSSISDRGPGCYFPLKKFDGFSPQDAAHVPDFIDGEQLYKISVGDGDWRKLTKDLRYFKMTSSSRRHYHGIIKTGWCLGSHVCPNASCIFRKTSFENQPNRINWKQNRVYRGRKFCTMCETEAVLEGCGARKLVDYNPATQIALVYHTGEHICWKKIDVQARHFLRDRVEDDELTSSARRRSHKTARQIAEDNIEYLLSTGTMEAADAEADTWIDMRTAQRLQVARQEEEDGPDINSFDAVGIIKRKTDTKDPYYIYRINNKDHNNARDYIFKTSTMMAQIAIKMDIDADDNHPMQYENAYFDATHTRVQGFKSFGLWTYHPAMAKILRLASMEIRSENATDITLFFRLFNEVLSQVKKQPGYRFNPRTFMCDEAGPNYVAIEMVYGKDFCFERVKGCQWHFKHDVKNKLSLILPEHREIFNKNCDRLCTVTSVIGYKILKRRLDAIGRCSPPIQSWIKWWHQRRHHIFPPFRGAGLPGCNLSEQGNSSLRCVTMRLVAAAKKDVATMILQEKEIYKFERNAGKSSGRGPSQKAREGKDKLAQRKMAGDFVDIFDNEEAVLMEAEEAWFPSYYIQQRNTKHRPKPQEMLGNVSSDSAEFLPPDENLDDTLDEDTIQKHLVLEEKWKKRRRMLKNRQQKRPVIVSEDSDEEVPQQRKKKQQKRPVIVSEDSDEEVPQQRKKKPAKKKELAVESSSDESLDEVKIRRQLAKILERKKKAADSQKQKVPDRNEGKGIPVSKSVGKKGSNPRNKVRDVGHHELEAVIRRARRIMGNVPLPTQKPSSKENRALVVRSDGTQIRKCAGCGNEIAKENKTYPRNLVLRKKGEKTYWNKKFQKELKSTAPVHFHLSIECLRKYDVYAQFREISINEEVFASLGDENLHWLHEKEMLKHLVINLG